MAGKATTGEPKRPRGRPRKLVSSTQVTKLARLNCTVEEIADFFDLSKDTLERNYAEAIKKGRAAAKMDLRTWQRRAAKRGAQAVLIFLGKNELGQRDEPAEADPPDLPEKPAGIVIHAHRPAEDEGDGDASERQRPN